MADKKGEVLELDKPSKKIYYYYEPDTKKKQISREIYPKSDKLIHYPRGFDGGDKYRTIKRFVFLGFKGKLPVGVVKL